MGNKHAEEPALRSVRVELEVTINAARDRVWEVMVTEIDRWWRKDFHAIPDSKIILEPYAGGRMYEKTDKGTEGLWYQVTGIDPPNTIDFAGHLRPEYGGPATTLLRLSLKQGGKSTILQISDAIFGKLGDKMETNVSQGWRLLFAEGLKPFVELGIQN